MPRAGYQGKWALLGAEPMLREAYRRIGLILLALAFVIASVTGMSLATAEPVELRIAAIHADSGHHDGCPPVPNHPKAPCPMSSHCLLCVTALLPLPSAPWTASAPKAVRTFAAISL